MCSSDLVRATLLTRDKALLRLRRAFEKLGFGSIGAPENLALEAFHAESAMPDPSSDLANLGHNSASALPA